jgi:glutamyl-tRNA reductase
MVSQAGGAGQLTAALVTHRRAPLAVLERMPRGAALPSVLDRLLPELAVVGGIALSTCNRFELYLEGAAPVDRAALTERLAGLTGVPPQALGDALELVHGADAVRHLFTVASGLDSRLVGEEEILGQVRAAAREAEQQGTATPGLRALFQWAVRTGRRARRVAGLSEARISLATRAVEVMQAHLQPLRGRTVLLLGSGHMAGRVVTALHEADARPVLLVRRPESVRSTGVPVHRLAELPELIDRADAVLCATSAPHPVLGAELLARPAERRSGRPPLLVIDLAVPRNVEAPANRLDGVRVLDLDALADGGPAVGFDTSTRAALDVVAAEARAFCARREQSAAGPLIEQVLRHGESIRRAELARAARLTSAPDLQLLDELTARVVHKLLHAPIAAIRQHAGAGEADLAALIARPLAGEPTAVAADGA